MTDLNITEPVSFTGRDGASVTLHADYGGLAIRGDTVLEGEAAGDFICEAAAILMEARRREARRLRELEEDEPVPVDGDCPESKMDNGNHDSDWYGGGRCSWCGDLGPLDYEEA